MKILFHSVAPFWQAPSGYASQTRLFGPRIAALGHEVIFSAYCGLEGAPVMWQGFPVLPRGLDRFGSDVIGPHAIKHKADIVVTLMDAWTLDPSAFSDAVWCPWAPVDMDPIPTPVLDVLRKAYQPIAYSRFGERMMRDAGLAPLYVPHGVDTTVYAPGDQQEARWKLGIPADAFLVALVAANQARKCWPEQLRAVARLMRDHPDAWLYLHALPGTHGEGGAEYDLPALLAACAVDPDRVRWAEPYALVTGGFTDAAMATRYRAADVLLNVTAGEGFGLTPLEAAACGTVTISAGWAAAEELELSPWRVEWDRAQEVWMPKAESWQWLPDPDAIWAELFRAYEIRRGEPDLWRQAQEEARAGAMQYDADLVATRYWKPALDAIADRLAGRVPTFSEVAG